jgi:hypothetical protein
MKWELFYYGNVWHAYPRTLTCYKSMRTCQPMGITTDPRVLTNVEKKLHKTWQKVDLSARNVRLDYHY